MGKKNLLGLAGLVIASATLSGCASSRPQTNGPLMSGTPSMMGASTQQPGASNMGVAQNQTQNQTRGWNERGMANNSTGTSTTGMMPAGANTGNPYATGTNSLNTSRPATGASDRSYMNSSGLGTPNNFSRSSTTPTYPNSTSNAYPRSTNTTMPGNDRLLTSPTVPTYPSSTNTAVGSTMQPSTNKPTTSTTGTTVNPPPPVPVSATSPQFGSGSTSTGPTFTPQGGTNE